MPVRAIFVVSDSHEFLLEKDLFAPIDVLVCSAEHCCLLRLLVYFWMGLDAAAHFQSFLFHHHHRRHFVPWCLVHDFRYVLLLSYTAAHVFSFVHAVLTLLDLNFLYILLRIP